MLQHNGRKLVSYIFRHEIITKELASNTKWPPAHSDSGGLGGVLQRLHSAFENVAAANDVEGDSNSLLDSDAEVGTCNKSGTQHEGIIMIFLGFH